MSRRTKVNTPVNNPADVGGVVGASPVTSEAAKPNRPRIPDTLLAGRAVATAADAVAADAVATGTVDIVERADNTGTVLNGLAVAIEVTDVAEGARRLTLAETASLSVGNSGFLTVGRSCANVDVDTDDAEREVAEGALGTAMADAAGVGFSVGLGFAEECFLPRVPETDCRPTGVESDSGALALTALAGEVPECRARGERVGGVGVAAGAAGLVVGS